MTPGQEIGSIAYYLQAAIAPIVVAAAAYVKAQVGRVEADLEGIAKGLNRLADAMEKPEKL
jgi:hypothetical protein